MCPYLIQVFLQILDGVLTYIGVRHLGMGVGCEANPIVKFLMIHLGPFAGLLVVKSIGIIIVWRFLRPLRSLVMLQRSMFLINILYTVTAIQWLYFLL